MNLEALLAPKSIAVVGGNLDTSTWGGRVVTSLQRLSPSIELALVNRRSPQAEGLISVAKVADLPNGVDQVLIAAPAPAVPDLVRECSAAGIRSAVVFSSGFGESVAEEAATYQARLQDAIAATGMVVLGPNCLGYNRVLANGELLAATSTSVLDLVGPEDLPIKPTGIGIATQSGGVGAMTQGHLFALGAWPRAVVHTGNEAVVRIQHVVDWFVEDPLIDVIGVYLEGIGDPATFADYARRVASAGKQLVALVGGRSAAGGRAVQSHSGRLASDGRLMEQFLRRHGVPLARDMQQFAVALATAAEPIRPMGHRLGIVTASGGFGTVAADLASDSGYEIPELSLDTQAQLAETLPSFGSTRNPVDVTGVVFSNPDMLSTSVKAVAGDALIDAVLVTLGAMGSYADAITEGLLRARADDPTVPLFVKWPHGLRQVHERLRAAGVVVVETEAELIGMLDLRRELAGVSREGISGPGDDVASAAELVARGVRSGIGAAEHHAKSVLAAIDIPSPAGELVRSAAEAAEAAGRIGGTVVVKGHHGSLVHKAELGLVELGVRGEADARAAFERVAGAMAGLQLPPEALVEQQSIVRQELLVGWSRNELGTAIVFGTGGSNAEEIDDVAVRLAPLDDATARAMITETVAGRTVAARFPELVDTIAVVLVKVSELAAATRQLAVDLDINPLAVVEERRLCVLDACLSPSNTTPTTHKSSLAP